MGFPLPGQQSDAVAIALVPATPTALTASFVASGVLDVRNFSSVDWNMAISNAGAGPVTRVDLQWEFAETAVPVAADWTPLQTEAITAGVSTPSTYEVQQPITGLVVPFTRSWTTEVKGRWMRILVKGFGDATSSAIVLTALRRV
jgi:hypothetical protein